jgi:capsular polysaccharide biosynthesis protein
VWTTPVMTRMLATTASSSTHMMHRLTINSITPILSSSSSSSNNNNNSSSSTSIEDQYTNIILAYRPRASASMANSIKRVRKHSIPPCLNIRNISIIHRRC